MSMFDDRETLQKWIVPVWIIYIGLFMFLPVIAIAMDRSGINTGWVMWTAIVMFALAPVLGYFSAVVSREPDSTKTPVIMQAKKGNTKKKTLIASKDEGADYVPVKPKAPPQLKEKPN